MTDALAVESLQQAAGTYLDQYNAAPSPVLAPAFSVHDGRAWSVIPAIRKVTRTVGKGKDKREVPDEEAQMVALTSDHLFIPYDPEPLAVYGLQPHPKPFLPKPPFKWHTADAIRYVKDRETGRDTKDLFDELVDVFKTYVEYGDSVYYDLMALYILQTYTFMLWPATGYLHFNGTLASGKSRSLDVIEAIGYNGRQGTSFKPATVYRLLEGNPGVLCMDEREMFKTDEQKDLYSNLLGGYRSNGLVYINDKVAGGQDWRPTAYSLYSPKAIASINQTDPTLASRSIIIPMVPAIKQPAELPDDPAFWRALINDLHIWALQNAVDLQRRTSAWNRLARTDRAPKLRNRAWEVSRPYLVIADSFDPALADRMVAYFDDYFVEQGKRMQETDKAMMLLRVLPRVMHLQPAVEQHYYSTKLIHETMLDYLEADQRDYYKTRHVNTHMTTLRFTDTKQFKGARHYRLDEEQIRATFRHRDIQPFDEDEDWFQGQVSYADPAPSTQESFDMSAFANP